MLKHPEDFEPVEVAEAKNIAQNVLDGNFYGDTFFESTEDGELPDFIGLADKIIEELLAAGIHIPTDLRSKSHV